ncbi:MAG: choice-of-anchor tandem repeat GloVer-containing protein, partial [Verrucomicrobiota bacterium]
YGTTTGLNDPSGYGTVFKINLSGSAGAVLKYFAGGDGANPHGGLVLAGNTLYGTTASGTPGLGTVYAVNTDGSGFTNLYSFTGGNDGAFPNAGLVLSGSELFGTTMGFTSCKDWNCYTSYGTVFKINTNGSGFTVLYNFGLGAGSAGLQPSGALVLSGGMLYGDFFNTVFKVNTNGSGFTVLYGFSSYGSDGANPYGDLLLSGGTLYGTTYSGGINGEGTVFALNLSIPLNAAVAGGQMVLSWSDPTFSLQAAPIVTGPYQTVDGATSPYANAMTNSQMFFRLQQ